LFLGCFQKISVDLAHSRQKLGVKHSPVNYRGSDNFIGKLVRETGEVFVRKYFSVRAQPGSPGQ
jgi:hypothetical protein